MTKINQKKAVSRREYTMNIQKVRDESEVLVKFDNIDFEKRLGLGTEQFRNYKEILNLEFSRAKISDENNIKTRFSAWKECFSEIYHDSNLELDLYFRHSYLIFILNCTKRVLDDLIHEFYGKTNQREIIIPSLDYINQQFFPFLQNCSPSMDQLKKALLKIENQIYSIIREFLDPTNEIDNFPLNPSRNLDVVNSIKGILNMKGDLFNLLYQDMILPTQRHKIGEFYTPIPLVRLMLDEVYRFGDVVIDPACGTATFLIEIMKIIIHKQFSENNVSSQSIAKIFQELYKLKGIEINPLTNSVAILNIFSLIVPLLITIKLKKIVNDSNFDHNIFYNLPRIIQNDDFLLSLEKSESLKASKGKNRYDLVIGNPPWLVINGIHSKVYKESIKDLAKKYGINTNKQNTSNLEISSLFIVKAVRDLLKDNGRLGLVLSAGILTGSQNDRLREFNGLKEIYFWRFDKDIFNIHNICMFATKGSEIPQKKYKISVETKICSDNPIMIQTGSKDIYMPQYFQSDKKNLNLEDLNSSELSNVLFGRLIPETETKTRKCIYQSVYHDLFRQGACLGPRNLIFSQELSLLDDQTLKENIKKKELDSISEYFDQANSASKLKVLIKPDPDIGYKVYSNWDFKAYTYAIIKPSQIYEVAKTTDLIPFLLLKTTQIFLPINPWDIEKISKISENVSKNDLQEIEKQFEGDSHYQFLNSIYQDKIKSGAAIPTLFKNMNHNNKMLNYHQLNTFKLVYNGIGTIVKASLVNGAILIDSSLYYITPKDEDEAFYLLGVLNSPIVSKLVGQMGSTGSSGSLRNIHKNPLNVSIPGFESNPLTEKIIQLSKEAESYVTSWVINYLQKYLKKIEIDIKICPFCEKFIDRYKLENHLDLCSQKDTDFKLYALLFNKLDRNDFENLSNVNTLFNIIKKKEYIPIKTDTGLTSHSIIIKERIEIARYSVIIHGLLKPKTIQKALFKNTHYLTLLATLNDFVEKLIE